MKKTSILPLKTRLSASLKPLQAGIAALGILSFTSVSLHAAAPQYTVTDLGTGGAAAAIGMGVNASGQVTGYNTFVSGGFVSAEHAVRWTGTTPTDLGTLGGTQSYGYSINDAGQVSGYATIAGNSLPHAVRWTGTTAADLGNLGGTYSIGIGINASGQVAGSSELSGGAFHAVRWTDTTATDLGTLGGTYSTGYGINASGQVAGVSHLAGDLLEHATLWTGTTATDLGTLGGTLSLAAGINNAAQVAGYAYLAGDAAYHAVLWTGTTATDLGTLGGNNSFAGGINSFGDVVGMSGAVDPNDPDEAFIYTGGMMYALSGLLLPGSGVTFLNVNQYGNSINDLGQITGYGRIGGETHALLLTPVAAAVPEPMTLAWGLSCAALLGVRKRLRK